MVVGVLVEKSIKAVFGSVLEASIIGDQWWTVMEMVLDGYEGMAVSVEQIPALTLHR